MSNNIGRGDDMDIKEQQTILHFYSRLEGGMFDEWDVYSFLILVREKSKIGTALREFGDFIAHREKDRGYIKEYIDRTKYKLERLGKINTKLVIKEVFTYDEICKSINDTLQVLNLNPLSDEIITGIILCIMSLLQEVMIFDKKKNIGKLVLARNKDQIILLGIIHIRNQVQASFPVLSIQNRYPESMLKKSFGANDTPINFESVIKITNICGKLTLQSTIE